MSIWEDFEIDCTDYLNKAMEEASNERNRIQAMAI
jgi:hypothetical protein